MSGDGARVAYPLFQMEDGGANPTSPLQLNIVEIDVHRAQELNKIWHSRLPVYQIGFAVMAKICFGAIYNNKIYACAILYHPLARLLPQHTWLELRRMAISNDAPKYTASRMLSIMAKIIRKKFPQIIKLISYQDVETHNGTIYKAAGWKQGHYHKGSSWESPNSISKAGKRRINMDQQKATGPKIRWEKDLR